MSQASGNGQDILDTLAGGIAAAKDDLVSSIADGYGGDFGGIARGFLGAQDGVYGYTPPEPDTIRSVIDDLFTRGDTKGAASVMRAMEGALGATASASVSITPRGATRNAASAHRAFSRVAMSKTATSFSDQLDVLGGLADTASAQVRGAGARGALAKLGPFLRRIENTVSTQRKLVLRGGRGNPELVRRLVDQAQGLLSPLAEEVADQRGGMIGPVTPEAAGFFHAPDALQGILSRYGASADELESAVNPQGPQGLANRIIAGFNALSNAPGNRNVGRMRVDLAQLKRMARGASEGLTPELEDALSEAMSGAEASVGARGHALGRVGAGMTPAERLADKALRTKLWTATPESLTKTLERLNEKHEEELGAGSRGIDRARDYLKVGIADAESRIASEAEDKALRERNLRIMAARNKREEAEMARGFKEAVGARFAEEERVQGIRDGFDGDIAERIRDGDDETPGFARLSGRIPKNARAAAKAYNAKKTADLRRFQAEQRQEQKQDLWMREDQYRFVDGVQESFDDMAAMRNLGRNRKYRGQGGMSDAGNDLAELIPRGLARELRDSGDKEAHRLLRSVVELMQEANRLRNRGGEGDEEAAVKNENLARSILQANRKTGVAGLMSGAKDTIQDFFDSPAFKTFGIFTGVAGAALTAAQAAFRAGDQARDEEIRYLGLGNQLGYGGRVLNTVSQGGNSALRLNDALRAERFTSVEIADYLSSLGAVGRGDQLGFATSGARLARQYGMDLGTVAAPGNAMFRAGGRLSDADMNGFFTMFAESLARGIESGVAGSEIAQSFQALAGAAEKMGGGGLMSSSLGGLVAAMQSSQGSNPFFAGTKGAEVAASVASGLATPETAMRGAILSGIQGRMGNPNDPNEFAAMMTRGMPDGPQTSALRQQLAILYKENPALAMSVAATRQTKGYMSAAAQTVGGMSGGSASMARFFAMQTFGMDEATANEFLLSGQGALSSFAGGASAATRAPGGLGGSSQRNNAFGGTALTADYQGKELSLSVSRMFANTTSDILVGGQNIILAGGDELNKLISQFRNQATGAQNGSRPGANPKR